MAKIKIQGNASGTGTLTLTAPNTNADRTITLPDEDITLGGGDFSDGGDTAGADRTIGNNDAYAFGIETAGITAVTVDSSRKVGIGTTSPDSQLHVYSGTGGKTLVLDNPNNDYAGVEFKSWGTLFGRIKVANDGMHFYSNSGATSKSLQLTTDGRGLSQFTAKAWVNFDGTITATTIRDSHNVSSISDGADGDYLVFFTNNMANSNYAATIADNYTTAGTHNHTFENPATSNFKIRLAQFGVGNHTASIITAVVFGD